MNNQENPTGQIAPGGAVSIALRSYLSVQHLWAGRHFCAVAFRLERKHEGPSVFSVRHRAHVSGSILEIVAFLDATINEFFEDIADRHNESAPPVSLLSEDVLTAVREWWKKEDRGRRWSTLPKYDQALELCDREPFGPNEPRRRTAALVLALRNRLTHFRPETQDCQPVTTIPENDVSEQLHALGFALNPLMAGAQNPFFPDHCLSAGCTQWALTAIVAFTDEFFRRIGYEPRYHHNLFPDENPSD